MHKVEIIPLRESYFSFLSLPAAGCLYKTRPHTEQATVSTTVGMPHQIIQSQPNCVTVNVYICARVFVMRTR